MTRRVYCNAVVGCYCSGSVLTEQTGICRRQFYASRPHPSSVPLPASACALPAPPPASPPDIVGPVGGTLLVPTPGLTAEAPGLTPPRSLVLVFSRLLKKFCNTSCCVCPVGLGALPTIGDVGAPARLPGPSVVPELPPSISARARSTVGSEKEDDPNGPTRPAAGGAEVSTGLRNMPRGSRSARRAFSS